MPANTLRKKARMIRAPHGNQPTAKPWIREAPLHMQVDTLDVEVVGYDFDPACAKKNHPDLSILIRYIT